MRSGLIWWYLSYSGYLGPFFFYFFIFFKSLGLFQMVKCCIGLYLFPDALAEISSVYQAPSFFCWLGPTAFVLVATFSEHSDLPPSYIPPGSRRISRMIIEEVDIRGRQVHEEGRLRPKRGSVRRRLFTWVRSLKRREETLRIACFEEISWINRREEPGDEGHLVQILWATDTVLDTLWNDLMPPSLPIRLAFVTCLKWSGRVPCSLHVR